jgi:hypothetical protein
MKFSDFSWCTVEFKRNVFVWFRIQSWILKINTLLYLLQVSKRNTSHIMLEEVHIWTCFVFEIVKILSKYHTGNQEHLNTFKTERMQLIHFTIFHETHYFFCTRMFQFHLTASANCSSRDVSNLVPYKVEQELGCLSRYSSGLWAGCPKFDSW